jgi:hypothetical protein
MSENRTLRNVSLAAVAALFATGAYASPVDDLLTRNATQQTHIERDLSAARVDPLRAAQVEQRAGDVYRQQAQMLATADTTQDEQLRQAQRDLAGAISWAEKHPAKEHATAMDRMHLQVASMRNAEQQHLIATGVANGRLTPAQAATLEDAQAKIASEESAALANGHESIDEARAIQHQQNLQDYAIKVNPSV